MRVLALNGFRHSLDRYFNDTVECINEFNWTERNAIRLAKSITEPTILIGFSDGATACLTIACHCPHIKRVYAHSPMMPPSLAVLHDPDIRLFRTTGDKTPTYKHTIDIHIKLYSVMLTLPPVPHEPVTNLATFIMKIRGHQFRNCLPYLPSGITR